MAISNGQTSVGLTPVIIDGFHNMPYRITLKNIDNTADAFIGNESVTVDNGYALKVNESIQLVINPLDTVYVVSSKVGHKISWIRETL